MIKKLTRHGNSLALDISTDGHRLIVAPAEQPEKLAATQSTAHGRLGKAVKKRAEWSAD